MIIVCDAVIIALQHIFFLKKKKNELFFKREYSHYTMEKEGFATIPFSVFDILGKNNIPQH